MRRRIRTVRPWSLKVGKEGANSKVATGRHGRRPALSIESVSCACFRTHIQSPKTPCAHCRVMVRYLRAKAERPTSDSADLNKIAGKCLMFVPGLSNVLAVDRCCSAKEAEDVELPGQATSTGTCSRGEDSRGGCSAARLENGTSKRRFDGGAV